MAPTYASESQGDESTVRIAGDLDAGASDDLAEVLEAFIGARHRIVLDMAGVSELDAAGLQVIVEAASWAVAESGSLVIRNPSAVVRAALERAARLDLLEPGSG